MASLHSGRLDSSSDGARGARRAPPTKKPSAQASWPRIDARRGRLDKPVGAEAQANAAGAMPRPGVKWGMAKQKKFGDGELQLIQIIEAGDARMLRLALDAGADPLAMPAEAHGHSALMRAAYLGHESCVREIISRGGSESRNGAGNTTLSIAAQSPSAGAWNCIKVLIESGRDPLEKTDRGETPLMWACGANPEGGEAIALELARWGGASEPSLDGETCLMWAAQQEGHEWAMELLARAGANPLAAEHREGLTALMMACGRGLDKAAQALLEAFPEERAKMARQRSADGTIALMAAAQADAEECARLMLPWSDLEARDQYGNTALHYAGHWPVGRLLLEAGADILAKNNHGETPLGLICTWGSAEAISEMSAREQSAMLAKGLAEAIGPQPSRRKTSSL